MYQATCTEVFFQDPNYGQRGSDKFYRAYEVWNEDSGDARVLFQWGRRGSNGQSKVEVCADRVTCAQLLDQKIYSKEAKGYGNRRTFNYDVCPPDVLHLAGVRTGEEASLGQPEKVSKGSDPFVVVINLADRARRLAMGTTAEQAEAVVIRHGLNDQIAEIRRRTLELEGQLEVVDMVLSNALESV